MDRISGMKGAIAEKGEELASTVEGFVENGKDKVAKVAAKAAKGISQATHRAEEWATEAAETAGRAMKTGMEDVVELVKKHPIPAVLIGVGVGYLLARKFRE